MTPMMPHWNRTARRPPPPSAPAPGRSGALPADLPVPHRHAR
ncbi:hypothetical protein OG756_40845 [Streptomyces sp. NBC_01310]|nr:hypothetical protein OG756_00550 [Streptomyces sp. NBC_01310]WSJ63765.1 hypothetical protein OG756_40845 [Streptomyces sp. NBC_01310]